MRGRTRAGADATANKPGQYVRVSGPEGLVAGDTNGLVLQGDAKLLYASTTGVIPSIRLHAIRDGSEDHQLLSMLREQEGDAATEAIMAPVVTAGHLDQHTDDPRVIVAQRRRLLQALAERGPARGKPRAVAANVP